MIVKRYARVGASPVKEEIEFVSADDPRAIHLYDKEWQPVNVTEINFDEIQVGPIPPGTFEDEEDYRSNPMVWARGSNVISELPQLPNYDPNDGPGGKSNAAYINSDYWNLYSLELKKGYEIISESEYNDMVAASMAAVASARAPSVA